MFYNIQALDAQMYRDSCNSLPANQKYGAGATLKSSIAGLFLLFYTNINRPI